MRLVRLLGAGGMGSVWVADHLRLGTQVAVKFLSPALAKEAGPIMRFQHEAMAAAHIKSPHVVQVFDQGVFDGESPYMVMELLEGEDLSRRLAREGPLPPALLARVVAQTCKALGRAHAAGVVHRDVKPDNIFLVDQDGEPFVKVLDFGIAKRTDAPTAMGLTDTGSMIGTPYYMSPEQMLDLKQVDFRADLWSLGVVAYHCLIGQVPFEGKTIGGLCVAIEKGIFVPPSRLRPGLSPAVDAWFLRALHRDPAERFASAREMGDAFVAAVEGASAGARAAAKGDEPDTSRSFDSGAPGAPASGGAPPDGAEALGATIPNSFRDRLLSAPEGELNDWFTMTPATVSKTPPAVTTSTIFDESPTQDSPGHAPPPPPP
ncbi:MAG TPA: serine/threonine-protein kinase, partial [Polyangiaceae bacterium]|nr:serine/threonine-protein kinase [Polyangiaceae bacterium]